MLKALLKNIMLYFHNHQKRKIPIEYIFPILIRFFLIIYITEKFVSLLIFIFKNIQMILILIVKYFFFGSSKFGFFTLLAAFIEEIRTMKYLIDDYYDKAEKRNFTYNESLFNDPNGFYEEFYNMKIILMNMVDIILEIS